MQLATPVKNPFLLTGVVTVWSMKRQNVSRICVCGKTFRTVSNTRCKACQAVERQCRTCGKTYQGTMKQCRSCRAALDREKYVGKFRTYGLTLETYDQILAGQGGVCAGCGAAPPQHKRLAIDHDHRCCPMRKSCGHCVRGLLCSSCNLALGLAKDDPDRLLGLVRYLTLWS